MALMLDILKWSGIAAAALATAGLLGIGAMAWLLSRPIDDDGEESARRC
jgi:hypothetical protein